MLRDSTLFLLLLCPVLYAYQKSPFDVRIDHHKAETTRDLVVNTPRPRFSWKLPIPDDVSQRNIQQIAYQLQLESSSKFKWDSERVRSVQSIHVPYTGHDDLIPATNYRFRLRLWTTVSEQPSEWTDWIPFRTPIFDLDKYFTKNADALWIGSTKISMNELRKEFMVPNTSPVKTAVAYICGLGYYELYLNGNNVDPSRKLDPGWTEYEKRALLVSFDLTANITAGTHAVGVKLGNGWYSREQIKGSSYGPPRLLFYLDIKFENDDEMLVMSDQTWTGREGSILHDNIYNGEYYDSRRDRPDWARVGFNDSLSAWIMPESLPSPLNISLIVMQDMPPIRAGPDALHFETTMLSEQQGYLNSKEMGVIKGAALTDGGIIKPVNTWMSDSYLTVFDLGQNIAGWCRFKFNGPVGVGVYIRHGETLAQPTIATNRSFHNIYTESLRQAVASDSYVLRGDPNGEIYEPSFTYHGFQYVSVSGSPNQLTIDDVECVVVHSETTVTGHFATSNPVVNQIQHNIQWGQLSNMMSLPAACSQRDERTGWMGDASLSVDETFYNFDYLKLYVNFLNMIVDDQLDNGAVPNVVPGNSFPPDPNWGTALPTITWQLYRHYNDLHILETYYDHVRAYVEYIRSDYNSKGLVNLTCIFGDWVPPPPEPMTNENLISSFAFLHDVSVLINMSLALNKTADAEAYSAFYLRLAQEFHRVFFTSASNFYADGIQAAQILALALPNVVPASVRGAVVDHLISDINQKGNHASTGIVSTAQLYPVLSDNGHHDLALELISTITYPSYGYMFNNAYENATTVWELWNSETTGPAMDSRNHIMFNSVGAWFYSHLAGIDLSPDKITIRPRMASEAKKHLMKKIDCQLSTLHGLVHVSYTRDERDTIANSILLRVTVPPNAQARVVFEPLFAGGHCTTLIEGDTVIWSADANVNDKKEFLVERDSLTNLMTVSVGSGQYEFQALWH